MKTKLLFLVVGIALLLSLGGASNGAAGGSSGGTTAGTPSYQSTFSTAASGTIATGGTSQQAIAANPKRVVLVIQNPSSATESLWINFGTTAAVIGSPSFEIQAGQTQVLYTQQAVTINAATSTHAYTILEGQ